MENLKIYKPIIDSVKARLDTLKTGLDTLMNIKKRRQDSIAQSRKDSLTNKSPLQVKDLLVPVRTLELGQDSIKKN